MIKIKNHRVLSLSVVIAFLLVGFSAPSLAQLSKAEKKIVRHVDNHYDEAISLLEEVVNINSGTMNFDGVRKVGQIFRSQLGELGFETSWVDGNGFNRAGHLVAKHKGKGKGKKLLLIGHLDTVFELTSPFQKFEIKNDTLATGPGTTDMKGGDVIIVQALAALKKARLLKKMNITVIMIGDEEWSGRPLELARHDLIQAAKYADIALGFEDGDGDPKTAVISRRSASGWQLEVTGVPAHSSQVFTKNIGAGAIYEASRILNDFYEQLSQEEYLTFNPGVILGGTNVSYDKSIKGGKATGKSNIVAKSTIVTGDIRALSPEQLLRAQKTMQDIASKNLPQTSVKLTFGTGYPPLAPTDGNYKLLSYYDKISQELGFGPVAAVNPSDAGAADISFTSGHVDMAMDGLGLSGWKGHTVDETADLRALPMQTKRAAILIYRLTNRKYKD